ncbi:MAG TPA: NAD-dependent epimerase/dehydratase family protein [Herpetosiphonaceae bacterium]|nr:NAD-dependent epimerase/dehydratase family protein [Herpetosiphonaceae bacterium]
MNEATEFGTAFVTGGSGYLGRNLIRHLRERGVAVRALARSAAARATVEALGAAAVAGDLGDAAALAAGMRGCDVVFHCAASVSQWNDEAGAYAANVAGTEAALAASQAAGVPRFIHVSTEAVLAGGEQIVQATEAAPLPDRPVGLYPRTKGLAERRVLAAVGPDLAAVIVRPRLIWGNDDTTMLAALAEAVSKGRFMWFGGGRYLTSTAHVDNVCAGLIAAAERGRPGEIYFITDGEPIELRAFLTSLLATRGVEPGRRSIPRWLGRLIAAGGERIWRALRLPGEPPLTRATFNLIGGEVTVRDDKARRELGYAPVISRAAGLAALRAGSAKEVSGA